MGLRQHNRAVKISQPERKPARADRVVVGALLSSGVAALVGAATGSFAVTASGTNTWYVAVGSGGNCTVGAPCGSIDQAFRRSSAGDLIFLQGGAYPKQVIHATNAAAGFGRSVVVEPAPNARVTIAGIVNYAPYLTMRHLHIDASSAGACSGCGVNIAKGANHSQLIESSLVNATLTLAATDVAAVGNSIGPSGNHDGIDVSNGADGVLISHNFIHDLLVMEPNVEQVHVDCVQIYDSSNITVTANRLSNCSDRALIFSSGQRWGVTNVQVTNNFIRGCVSTPCQGSGYVVDARTAPGIWNLTSLHFVSNTVVDGMTLIGADDPGLMFRDNMIGYLGNCMTLEDHNLIAAINTGLCKSSSFLDPTSRIAPLPGFVNLQADDLHLKQADPSLRFASTIGQPVVNYDGAVRCRPSYVGADDPCAGSQSTETATPRPTTPLKKPVQGEPAAPNSGQTKSQTPPQAPSPSAAIGLLTLFALLVAAFIPVYRRILVHFRKP